MANLLTNAAKYSDPKGAIRVTGARRQAFITISVEDSGIGIASDDLPKVFASGKDKAEEPCTYCNRCLVNVVENPLGCYEEKRFPTREAMVAQIMSVFDPPAFVDSPAAVQTGRP